MFLYFVVVRCCYPLLCVYCYVKSRRVAVVYKILNRGLKDAIPRLSKKEQCVRLFTHSTTSFTQSVFVFETLTFVPSVGWGVSEGVGVNRDRRKVKAGALMRCFIFNGPVKASNDSSTLGSKVTHPLSYLYLCALCPCLIY